MSIPARVNLITLGVADVGRATTFYEALGWRRSSASTDDVSFFDLGYVVLGVFGRAALADDAGVPAGSPGFGGITLAINFEDVEAVGAAVVSWVAAGGTVVKQPERVFWGGYSGYLADLDGHLWEIAHNPYFPFDDRGVIQLP